MTGETRKTWIPFKYENLPIFCFGCGRMRHGLKECDTIPAKVQELPEDELHYFIALKAKSSMLGKESMKLGITARKLMKQCFYVGDDESSKSMDSKISEEDAILSIAQDDDK